MQNSVVFLLPNAADRPMGGYKVVFEYANQLSNDGYDVRVVYGIVSRPIANPYLRLAYKIARTFRYLKFRLCGGWSAKGWFALSPKIEELLRFDLAQSHIPKADFYIATAWSTAPSLAKFSHIDNDRKLYLIQSFEDWATTKDEVEATWRLPLRKIVIAPWLVEKGRALGVETTLIENGFDQHYFTLNNSISERNAYSVSMLYHTSPLKGCADGLSAIEIVKNRYPQLQATLFGTPERPSDLPDWINYTQRPNQQLHNQIYNNSAVYVAPSHIEGFALTPAEAMLCGAVVCATDIGGYTVVCHDNQTAMISPVGNAEAMAKNIIRVIEETSLRIEIATKAHDMIKQYTWERAYSKLKVLLSTVK